MKVSKEQLKRIIREEYTRLKIKRLVRESLDDLPPGQYSLSGMPGHSGVDKDDLAHVKIGLIVSLSLLACLFDLCCVLKLLGS